MGDGLGEVDIDHSSSDAEVIVKLGLKLPESPSTARTVNIRSRTIKTRLLTDDGVVIARHNVRGGHGDAAKQDREVGNKRVF